MIIRIFLSIITFSFSSTAICQSNALAYKVTYNGYIDLNGTSNQNFSLKDIIIHKGEKSISYYMKSADYKAVENDSTFVISSKKEKMSPVFKDYRTGKVVFEYNSGILNEKYNFFSDDLHPMEWVVTNRQKIIDSMVCFKAFTIFRGRSYVAWFNPEIRISEGPWKFGGLPGLIVDLYDEEKMIRWKFESLKPTEEDIPAFPQPRNDFKNFKKEFNAGYKRLVQATSAEESINPSCLTCAKYVEIKVQTVENLVD